MSTKPTYIKGDYKISKFFNNESRLVCGCSGLGGVWRPIEEKDAVGTLMYALENGVRVFDTAPSYNKSQAFLYRSLAFSRCFSFSLMPPKLEQAIATSFSHSEE